MVLSLVYAVVPAGAASVAGSDGDRGVFPQQTTERPEQTAQGNNSTVVHENPRNASGSDDLEDVERWLANRMSGAVLDCTEQVRNGSSYACRRLDRDYPEWAGRYVEVQRQSGDTSTERTDETLSQTRQNAKRFAEQVETFRELEDEYEEAKAEGNSRRARELAHRLVEQSRRINQTGNRATSNYDAFSNETSGNLSEASDAVVEIENDTATTASAIRDAELVATTLSAEATEPDGSFSSPLVVEGQLLSENGTPVSNRRATFDVGNGTVATQTDARGRFSFEYRPTTELVGPSEWNVTYVPTNASLYGGSRDRISVDVTGVEGTVTVTNRPSTVRFNDTLTVSGRVEAAGRGVDDVPVAVSLGGARLGTVRTNETGGYSLTTSVPVNVSAGDARTVAELPFAGRALSADNASAPVRVESMATRLTLDGNRTGGRVAHIEGQLETEVGFVAGREVEISVNGSTVGQVETGPDGRFSADVDLPSSVTASDTAVVTATYAGAGENLESASGRVVLSPTASGESGGLGGLISDQIDSLFARLTGAPPERAQDASQGVTRFLPLAAVVLAILGILVLGYLVARWFAPESWLRRLLGDGDSDGGEVVSPETPDPDPVPAQTSRDDASLLATARERLSNGDTDAAVLAGYEAVRSRLSDRLDRDSPMTHWELVQFYRARLAAENANALQQLTEAYERAAFSLQTSSEETAQTALENAARVLEEIERPSDSRRN
ncbi:HEPN domain-containing protein [Halopelagius inordinatus]|uniref:DUF4129 domain-containing protein n=1 Tax=Halopelagius inordinatus TaxID=553467 RepID=UPI0015A6FF84|nr:DUF4129 domain-containing protein [Halopelagius inordinatus]